MNTPTPLRPSHRGSTLSLADELKRQARKLEAQGQTIMYLQTGQPSTGAPKAAIEALHSVDQVSSLGYTGAAGTLELRARIAQSYDEIYGVEVDPRRVIVTVGASGALMLALIGAFEQGARVGLPQPFYFAYRYIMPTVGIQCVPFYPSAETHFQPTVADLEAIDGGIDGLIVGSPGNPTGSMMPANQVAEIAEYGDRKGIPIISDEIYHGLLFDNDVPQATMLAYSDNAIVINSFSKYYSMPGWRLGWMVVPESLVEPLTNLAHNMLISPSAASQVVGLAAFDCRDELDGHIERYRRNRDIMLREFPRLGFDRYTAPHGAFYMYCHVAHMHEDSTVFAREMLEGAGVMASAGSEFSPRDGHHYLRFSFAGKTADIEEAIRRIGEWQARG